MEEVEATDADSNAGDTGVRLWDSGGEAAPHNLNAEQALLGGLIIDPEQFDLIEGKVSEEDFFAPSHGMVFAAMQALRQRQQPVDSVLLRNELAAGGRLDAVGGAAGLAALTDAAVTGANVEHYAAIVQELSGKRALIKSLADSLKAASTPGSKMTDLLGEVENNIRSIVTRSFHDRVYPVSDVLKRTWDNLEKFMDGKELVNGLVTSFIELDQMLTGLHDDELIIIAGRPSMGKSTFALNVVKNVAIKDQRPAVVFTLEMSAENIVRNLLSAQAKVEGQKLRNFHLTPDDMQRLGAASGELHDAPLWIDETPAISLAELRGKARHLKLRHDIQLIVIDYLQLMTASNMAKNRSREQEVSEISRGLKALAKELHVPVIALSQLSRKPENRTENRPILSDLRESGAIEQDADVVLLLHRPGYYKPDDPSLEGLAEVIVGKQRNGPTGSVNLTFINKQLRFENMSLSGDYNPSEHI